jgi:hypothetical protein
MGALTSWNPQGLSKPVMGLLYTFEHIMLILFFTLHHDFTYRMLCDELAKTQDNAAEVIYRKTSYKEQVKLTPV